MSRTIICGKTYRVPSGLVRYKEMRDALIAQSQIITRSIEGVFSFSGPLHNQYDFRQGLFSKVKNGYSLCGLLNGSRVANELSMDGGSDACKDVIEILDHFGYPSNVISNVESESFANQWRRIMKMLVQFDAACEEVKKRRIEKAVKADDRRIRSSGKSNEVRGGFGLALVACMGPLGIILGKFIKWVFHVVLPGFISFNASRKAKKEVEGSHIGIAEHKYFAAMHYDDWVNQIREFLFDFYSHKIETILQYAGTVEIPNWGVPIQREKQLLELTSVPLEDFFLPSSVYEHVVLDPFDLNFAVSALAVCGNGAGDLVRLQKDIGNNWDKASRKFVKEYASTVDYKNEHCLLSKKALIEEKMRGVFQWGKNDPIEKLLRRINSKLAQFNRHACKIGWYVCSGKAAMAKSIDELDELNEQIRNLKYFPFGDLDEKMEEFKAQKFSSELANEILSRLEIWREYSLTVNGEICETIEQAEAKFHLYQEKASHTWLRGLGLRWSIWPRSQPPFTIWAYLRQMFQMKFLPLIRPISIDHKTSVSTVECEDNVDMNEAHKEWLEFACSFAKK